LIRLRRNLKFDSDGKKITLRAAAVSDIIPAQPKKEKDMKKTLLLALPVLLLAAACSSNPSREGHKCGKKDWHLTAEQKDCLKKQGCPKPDHKDGEEMDAAAKEKFHKCKKAAFEACGIEKPDHVKKHGKKGK
jgi:hypothetical protein